MRLAEQLSYADLLRIGVQDAGRRIWQSEGNEQACQRGNQQRRDDGNDLAHAGRAEQRGESGPEDKAQVGGDRHFAEVGAALVLVADVRQISVGNRYVSTTESRKRARDEQGDERNGEGEGSQSPGIDGCQRQAGQR